MAVSILHTKNVDPNVTYKYNYKNQCKGFTNLIRCVVQDYLPDTFDDVNAQTEHRMTALMFAVHHSMINMLNEKFYPRENFCTSNVIVENLIQHGANLDLADLYGNTALFYACRCSLENEHINTRGIELIKILLDAGANPNIKNKFGRTPLMIYIVHGHIVKDLLMELIIKSHLSITHEDNMSRTAFSYYIEKNLEVLDEFELDMLKGRFGKSTKSARF